jgi:cytochrome c oxidase subunit 1
VAGRGAALYDDLRMSRDEQKRGFALLASSDHKAIGLGYLWLALFSVFLGMAISLLLRFGSVWPGAGVPILSRLASIPDHNGTLAVLHGSLMVFFVLTAAPQAGFGSYFLPLQIGARETAFPGWNRLAFWGTAASFVVITSSFFLIDAAVGLNVYVAGVVLFCLAGLVNAVNFAVTVIDQRGTGMSLPRMPLTAWAWFVNAVLSMLIFAILLAASTLLLSDCFGRTHFFSALPAAPAPWSAPLAATPQALWQRLFWFFAQAQVYVAMLPCFGIVTHLLATFARRPVWKERLVVLALCAVGLCGFCVWGEHVFSSGLNPFSPLFFALLASSLGVPAAVLVVSWFSTLWQARLWVTTASLFTLGFVSLFLTGGLSGVLMARSRLVQRAPKADFVTGHFHLVMGIAATFALLAALFFWFPKMFARRLNESVGKLHFWVTFAGVYAVFLPMHWLGLFSTSATVSGGVVGSVRTVMLAALVVTVAAQFLFFANLAWTLARGKRVQDRNPWRATTLEWSLPSPPPADDFGATLPAVYRGAYEFQGPPANAAALAQDDFWPQHLAPSDAQGSR